MGRSKHSVHWRCKRRLLWDSGSRCRMLELGSNGCDKLCMVPETRFRKQEPRGETRPRVAVPAPGRPEGLLFRKYHMWQQKCRALLGHLYPWNHQPPVP